MTLPLLALVLAAQAPAPLVDLPFEMVGGRVYVETQVGSLKQPMIVDSGAGVTLLDTNLAKSIGARFGSEIPVGGAGEESQKGALLRDVFVRLDGGKAQSQAFLALSLAGLAPFEGRPMYGILGSDLFNRYAVQIDYAANRLRLYPNADFRYAGKAQSIPIRFEGFLPHVDATVEVEPIGRQKVTAMVDTGAGSAVSLTTAFDARFGLSGKLPKGPVAPLSGGVGGMTQGRLLRLKAFEVGEHRLESPVSTLTLSQGGALGVGAKYDCILGAEILRRFLVTFDYKSKRMWLEPSPALTEPFEVDHAGILLKSEGNDFLDFVVYEVVPESPAAEAGLRKDDEILELDDVDLASMTLDILRKRFRRGGKPWRIKVRRGGETLEVTVRPRPLA